jgi:hypothetical protein
VSDHEDAGPGTPPWLISFGDMMTLFLCFFIVLVTMAPQQDAGLVAAGIGEFVNVLEGSGVGGALDGSARLEKVNEYRRRFGLRPLTLEEYLAGTADTKSSPSMESMIADALCDYSELSEPSVVTFEAGSAVLTPESLDRIDRLVSALTPGRKQLLVLEGRSGVNPSLAARRALIVRQRLLSNWRFLTTRVEGRGVQVHGDPDELDESSRSVDVRLVEPHPSQSTP